MFYLIQTSYFIATFLFILGLRQMSSPRTAVRGIQWAGWGMLLAVVMAGVFSLTTLPINSLLMVIALVLGTGIAWYSGSRVEMTAMPQMIALYNGMGGGAAAAIAAIEWLAQSTFSFVTCLLILFSAVIGMVSFSGSLIAFAKLQGWLRGHFRGLSVWNGALSVGVLVSAVGCVLMPQSVLCLIVLFSALVVLGITITLPIGGANMPVVISLFNAMTGLAVGLEGFALNNAAMMVAGHGGWRGGDVVNAVNGKGYESNRCCVFYGRIKREHKPPSASRQDH